MIAESIKERINKQSFKYKLEEVQEKNNEDRRQRRKATTNIL